MCTHQIYIMRVHIKNYFTLPHTYVLHSQQTVLGL